MLNVRQLLEFQALSDHQTVSLVFVEIEFKRRTVEVVLFLIGLVGFVFM